MYLSLTFFLMLHSFCQAFYGTTKWKRHMLLTTSAGMLVLFTHQIIGMLCDTYVSQPSEVLIRLSQYFNSLSVPIIGSVVLMLTRHTNFSRTFVWSLVAPSFILLLLATFIAIPLFHYALTIYTGVLGIILCSLGFFYYYRYNQCLKDNYANIESYSLKWLGVLLVMLFITVLLRQAMASSESLVGRVFPLFFNMFVWYYLGVHVHSCEEAVEIGVIPSIFSPKPRPSAASAVYNVDSEAERIVSYDMLMQRIINIVKSRNLMGSHNLNALYLAKEVGCSKDELYDFLLSRNTNFYNFITDIRLEYSAELLATTQDTIADISEKCGFKCERRFRHMFFDKFGCKPREYRSSASANSAFRI